MTDPTTELYDGLAPDYHWIYPDWSASLRRQGEALDRILTAGLGPAPHRVLDCACGIGTQALGLARLGHRVTGCDVSAGAVARARQEARTLGLDVAFHVADMRALDRLGAEGFDAVLACDNALPHLLTPEDLRRGVGSMLSVLRPGGLFLASIRDYDRILAERPGTTPPAVAGAPGERRVTFQIWSWQPDGRTYAFELFVLRETARSAAPEGAGAPAAGASWDVRVHRGRYRALPRAELSTLLGAEGATEVAWRSPEESGFFQPLVVARRP